MKLVKTQNQFTHDVFEALTTIVNDNNDIFFIGKEVCEILGYSNTSKAISDHCKGSITFRYETSEQGGNPNTLIIPERDLYRLIMRSKKEEAEKFEEWVVSEVLPTIRKTGSYSIQQEFNVPKTFKEALLLAVEQQEVIEKQQQQLIEQAPKVEFYNDVADTTQSFDLQEASATLKLNFGRNKFFSKLRNLGILMKDNIPYRKFIDKGYFIVVESKWINNKTQTAQVVTQTRITQKGLEWLQKNKSKIN